VRKEHAERGDPLPPVVKSGPDNPLGLYAMRLGITPARTLSMARNNAIAVAWPLRMLHPNVPEDIEDLFPLVPVNTPVWLVNEPVKVARVGGQVWLEVHPPVDAEGQRAEVDLESFYALANTALGETPAAIHWDFVLATLKDANGLPAMVGLELAPDALPPAPPPLPETPAAPAEPTPAVPAALPETPAVPAS
jgi:L,D-transpeptidase ErfK/SrfK